MKIKLILAMLTLALAGCDEKYPAPKLPATDDVLARYQTIRIGQAQLTLPTIALLSSTENSRLTLSDGSEVPIKDVLSQSVHGTQVAMINISLSAYREMRDYPAHTQAYVSRDFCPKLLAQWEKDQCKSGLYNGKDVFLPTSFAVIKRDYLMNSKEQIFAIAGGAPTGGAAARTMLATPGGPRVSCVEQQKPLCTAVMAIEADLVAVWATHQDRVEFESQQIIWIMKQYMGR